MYSLFFPKTISPELFPIWSWTLSLVSAILFGPNPERPILFIFQKIPVIATQAHWASSTPWDLTSRKSSAIPCAGRRGNQWPDSRDRGKLTVHWWGAHKTSTTTSEERECSVECISCPSLGKAALNTISFYTPVLVQHWTTSGHRMVVAATRETITKTLRKGKEKDASFKRA